MDPVTIFATLAAILTIVYSLPQAVKVYLSNLPKAISGFTIVFMVFSSLALMLYGYFGTNELVAAAYLCLFIISLFILLLILQKAGIHRLRIFIASVVLGTALALTLYYFPKEGVGYFGGILSAFMVIPQGFKMIRQREATGVSGLSYLLLAAASLCWLAYGHLTGNMVLLLPNLVIFPTASLVYINVIKYRSQNFLYQSVKAVE